MIHIYALFGHFSHLHTRLRSFHILHFYSELIGSHFDVDDSNFLLDVTDFLKEVFFMNAVRVIERGTLSALMLGFSEANFDPNLKFPAAVVGNLVWLVQFVFM